MRGFRFENFRVLPENETAVARCRQVANLEEGSASPLLLLGGPGEGKTHLLWSIVNGVRDLGQPAALVLVTPNEFPERVKLLASNPEPIQRSRHGVLLVDGLERFTDDAATLEGVVKAFLDSHLLVVMSASKLPIQLEAFSAEFKRWLSSVDTVHLGGIASPERLSVSPSTLSKLEVAKSQRLSALAEEQQTEIEQLRESNRALEAEQLRLSRELREAQAAAEESRRRAAKQEETERLARQSETRITELQENAARLGEALAQARGERDEAQELVRELEARIQELMTGQEAAAAAGEALEEKDAEIAKLRRHLESKDTEQAELRNAIQEREAELETGNAEIAQLVTRVGELEQQSKEMTAGIEEAGREQARLQGLVDAAAHVEEALREAREERDRAVDEARGVAEQAAAVLDHLVATQPDTADASGDAYPMIVEFLSRLREQRSAGDLELTRRLAGIVEGDETAAQQELRTKLDEAASSSQMHAELYEESRAEQGKLSVEAAALRGRLQETTYELERARKMHNLLTSEIDGIRQSAAGDAAESSVLLNELANKLRELADWCAPGGKHEHDIVHYALAGIVSLLDQRRKESGRVAAPPDRQPALFEEAERSRELLDRLSQPGTDAPTEAEPEDEFASTIDRILTGEEPE